MTYAVFKITDGTASGTVDLVNGPLYIKSWAPVIPDYKGGGQFIDPPISSGRRIAFGVRENAVERVDFAQRASDGDAGDKMLAKLVWLMDKAARHWTSNGKESPVWVEIKTRKHEAISYAKLVVCKLSGMSNRFDQPYVQGGDCAVAGVTDPELTLMIERMQFTGSAPGTVSTLPLTGNQHTINMLLDPSFDDGSLVSTVWIERNTDYTRTFVIEPAYHGNLALKQVATSSATGGTYQDVEGLEASTSVTCTVMAFAETGTAKLTVYDGGGFTGGSSDTTTSSTWTQLSVNKTVPAGGSIRFALELGSTGDVAYFDYASVQVTYGDSGAETTGKIFIANGLADSPITHIYLYDSGWSSNLVYSTPPFNLLPASPQVGDAVYFGSSDPYGGGPFGNILLNLSAVADVTLSWEYADATGTWRVLNVVDYTDNFSQSGENVVSFVAAGDGTTNPWAAYTIAGVSVTAFWVRAYVSAVGSTGAATQATYAPYTIPSNYIEIPDTNMTGDSPASVDLDIENEGAATATLLFEGLDAGTNDGLWDTSAGTGVTNGATANLGQESAIMLRYPSVAIPQGAKISSATIRPIYVTGTDGPWTTRIYVQESDDAAVLNTGVDETTARTYSDTTKDWTIQKMYTINWDSWWAMPDVRDLVQEIVDRPGWVSGNAMCFKIQDWIVGATDYHTFQMYDSTFGGNAWILDVQYVEEKLYTTNIIMGSRKTSRGSDFRSIINFTRYQRDAITVTLGENTTWGSGPFMRKSSIPARDISPSISIPASTEDGSFKDRVITTIPAAMSSSFGGRFRVLTRTFNDVSRTTTDAPVLRLRMAYSGQSSYGGNIVLHKSANMELMDLGLIDIPEVDTSEQAESLQLAVQARAGDSAVYFTMQDLILIPVDEWSAEITAPNSSLGSLTRGKTVSVKSIDTQNRLTASMVNANGRTSRWSASGRLFKPPLNETTRVWFIAVANESIDGTQWSPLYFSESSTNIVFSVTAGYIKSYLLYSGVL